ncbi:MAG TPA: HD domain-containing phosphohydrolase [Pyrinomonadaceae bacterium]
MKYKLLIVDDEMANLRLLERLFSQEYQCLTAGSAAEAIYVLEQHDVAIVITDQRMPGMTGIELLKRTATLRPHMVRILLTGYTDVEALVEAINCGLVYMYFTKPWNNEDLKMKVSRARDHYEDNRQRNSLKMANARLAHRIKDIKTGVLGGLVEMSLTRSQEAYDHGMLVMNCASAIGEKVGLTPHDIEDLSAAAMLLELGKTGLLRNASRRGASVRPRNHLDCEARLLSSLPELGSVADIIAFQSENYDGTGVPNGLGGDQIPLVSRVLRVADEYHSLVRPKATVAAMTHPEAMRFLSQRSGKQFDPEIINVLQQLDPDRLTIDVQSLSEAAEYGEFIESEFEPSFADSRIG